MKNSPSISLSGLKTLASDDPAIGLVAMMGIGAEISLVDRAGDLSWVIARVKYNGVLSSSLRVQGGKLATFLDIWARLRYVDKLSFSLSSELKFC